MSSFEVWLLLVLIPNLGHVMVPAILISLPLIVFGFGWLVVSWEDAMDLNIVEEYKSKGCWDRWKEKTQQHALRGVRGGKKLLKTGLITLLISSLGLAAIPDRKEMAAIVLVPYATNNPEFKKIPENVIKLLNKYLTDLAEDTTISNNKAE